jgi:NAD(P)-dependent dehydrogenase (short-subunit alcohol dehydrogenase family)
MGFIWSQLFVTPTYPTGSYQGQTVVVTGSNVGLGKETARHFARLGASKVILAVRNLDKGNIAKEDIEKTENLAGKDVVQVWQLDMASYDSVKEFAKRVETLPRLDKFIANAGIATGKYAKAEENESTITVNVVSTFLLALLVAPKLKETATKFNVRPTLTIVSSEVHGWSSFPQKEWKSTPKGKIFDTLNDEKTARMDDRYMVSKLLEVLSIRKIAELHPASALPFTINTANPGLCHS